MKKKYSALPDSMKDMEMYGFHWMEFVLSIALSQSLLTSRKSNGLSNACMQSWTTFTGGKNGYFAIVSAVSKYGHLYRTLHETGEAVINFMSADRYDACMSTCRNNGFDTDEIKAAGLTPVPADLGRTGETGILYNITIPSTRNASGGRPAIPSAWSKRYGLQRILKRLSRPCRGKMPLPPSLLFRRRRRFLRQRADVLPQGGRQAGGRCARRGRRGPAAPPADLAGGKAAVQPQAHLIPGAAAGGGVRHGQVHLHGGALVQHRRHRGRHIDINGIPRLHAGGLLPQNMPVPAEILLHIVDGGGWRGPASPVPAAAPPAGRSAAARSANG